MTRYSGFIFLGLLLLFSSPAYCNGEKDALWRYFDALSKGDARELKTLLSANFEYDFHKDGKLYRLSRAEELTSIGRIRHDIPSNRFAVPDRFLWQNKENLPLARRNRVKIILPVFFDDSPKVYTDSIFRGAVLELDETLIVTLDDKHRILKIVEQARGPKGRDELSFGDLKLIYLKKGKESCRDDNGPVQEGGTVTGDLVCTLFEKKSHRPLLIRTDKDAAEGGTVSFYWPDRKRIKNLDF